MNQTRLLLAMFVITAAAFISSCSPSIYTTASWVNKEKVISQPYKSVFIAVFSENLDAKTALENDLAAAAKTRGLQAYTSLEYFGPMSTKESLPTKDAFLKKVNELGAETVFTVALVNKESELRYNPGSTPMYGYGGFGGYYGYAGGYYSSGYYSTDKTYTIESNLYDTKTEALLLSIQSKAENPPAIQKASKIYMESLVGELNKLGYFK